MKRDPDSKIEPEIKSRKRGVKAGKSVEVQTSSGWDSQMDGCAISTGKENKKKAKKVSPQKSKKQIEKVSLVFCSIKFLITMYFIWTSLNH